MWFDDGSEMVNGGWWLSHLVVSVVIVLCYIQTINPSKAYACITFWITSSANIKTFDQKVSH